MLAETPTLYVCHGDDGGPRRHPCRRVQEALRAAGIEYEKVIAAHGHPIPFLRKARGTSCARRPETPSCQRSSCRTGRSSPTLAPSWPGSRVRALVQLGSEQPVQSNGLRERFRLTRNGHL
jgi:hypothetical protein